MVVVLGAASIISAPVAIFGAAGLLGARILRATGDSAEEERKKTADRKKAMAIRREAPMYPTLRPSTSNLKDWLSALFQSEPACTNGSDYGKNHCGWQSSPRTHSHG